jgi:hypothetical protein
MSLSAIITANHTFPAGRPVTLAALRKGFSISFGGSVSNGDLDPGAVTPSKSSPGAYWYAVGVLTGSTYAITLDPALTAYASGVLVRWRPDTTNAGAVDVNVNGLGAKNIFKFGTLELAPGDLRAGQEVAMSYDAAGNFQIVSPLGNQADRPVVLSTGTTPAYVVALDNAPTNLTALAGVPIRWKASFTYLEAGGAATLNVNATGARSIYKRNGQVIQDADIRTATIVETVYDATLDAHVMTSPVAWPVSQGPLFGSVRNLVASNKVGSESTHLLVVVDELVLKNASNQTHLYGGPLAANVIELTTGSTGAGGLDSGSENASTWYYVWAIYNVGTNTLSGVLSTSLSAPTMPSGYTFKALIGVVRNDGSSNLVRFYQTDRRISIEPQAIFTAKTAAANDTWEALAGADLTAFRAAVPPIARTAIGLMGSSNTGIATGIAVAGCKDDGTVDTGQAIGMQMARHERVATTFVSFAGANNFEVPVRGAGSNNIQWKSPVTTNESRMVISGFTI